MPLHAYDPAGHGATPTSFAPEPCDEHLQFLASTHAQWARGAALFGPGGLLDAQRKKTVSAVACQLRDEYAAQGVKTTEKQLESESHCHSDYTVFLDTMEARRADWLLLDAQRDEAQLRLKVYTYTAQPMRGSV